MKGICKTLLHCSKEKVFPYVNFQRLSIFITRKKNIFLKKTKIKQWFSFLIICKLRDFWKFEKRERLHVQRDSRKFASGAVKLWSALAYLKFNTEFHFCQKSLTQDLVFAYHQEKADNFSFQWVKIIYEKSFPQNFVKMKTSTEPS